MHGDFASAQRFNSLWWLVFILIAALGVIAVSDSLLAKDNLGAIGRLMLHWAWPVVGILTILTAMRAWGVIM
jgi:hypothetical protein